MDNSDYYLGKMLGRLIFLDFVEDINYGPWLAMGFFRRPKTPKGGNQKHTMNYWRKKKRILSSNSGNYGDIH